MKKRWLIRSFFIGLLVLCAGAWVGSYWREVCVYKGDSSDVVFVLGKGRFALYRHDRAVQQTLGWQLAAGSPNLSTCWPDWDSRAAMHGAGFCYFRDAGMWMITIPLWLHAALSALLLWIAWRKAKPNQMGRAFPIEPTAMPR